MSLTVTAATGNLGRLVVQALLDRGVPPQRIVAAVRSPEKAADLAERGIEVREADYSRPETLRAAFAGTERLLLVSSSAAGARTEQHLNVIEAAEDVPHLVYTSAAYADSVPIAMNAEHAVTEEVIRESGIPFTILRNNWYLENLTGNLGRALESGAIVGAAGEGRLSSASRADYAQAAAVVLTEGDRHLGLTYELAGDRPFTMLELAAEVSRQSGRDVAYRNLPQAQYAATLAKFGVPEVFAAMLAERDGAIARDEFVVRTGELARLIGRPATTFAEAVSAALK
ncbi:SDR family oxidoreductase [Streptomyces sp. NPDC004539]|uniref:SDR family oxidoreductase n=1 Tax=Streptomyces sp. NPDC004539 TaxID=3154280 RepID=UPI0033A76FB6